MRTTRWPLWFSTLALAALLAACATPSSVADWTTWEDGYAEFAALAAADGGISLSATAEPQRYILSNNGVLRGVDRVVSRRGDTLVSYFADAGFAVVETRDPGAYARYANVIVRDVVVSWRAPVEEIALEGDFGNPPNSGDDDFFFDLQWGHDAVNAPEAWNAGEFGGNTRVAVLDGGFDLDHPDLASQWDLASGQNFVPGEALSYGLPDPFSHGTHVAGTIGAADNAFGVIGVAPGTTLVPVKVLSDAGSGAFSWVMAGMVHAADVNADIANMSLGATLNRSGFCTDDGCVTARELAGLFTAMQRVLNYGTWAGTLYVVSAGNNGRDLNADADIINVPAQLARTLTVSATTPLGWAAAGFDGDFDVLASYSNFGRSGVDVSAPGGSVDYPGNENCLVAGLVRPCWVFDLVFSTGNGSWYWSAGTSMAAPHVAGIGALILGEMGGTDSMTPAQLERAIIDRAADLGQPGKDPVHGNGAVRSGY